MNDLHPLLRYRHDHNLTQRQLAAKIGCSFMSVARWETGLHLPRRDQWAAIKVATGLVPAEFIPHLKTAVSP